MTYAASEIANILDMTDKIRFLGKMHERDKVWHQRRVTGHREVECVGKVRARMLFNASVRSIDDLNLSSSKN
ncbi:MAG: hypothetical protein QXN15_01045 [Candidatus Jordarchaeales archaeon]|nr:hypothetical protein [Candidatus Jordarchaeia archaeon]